MPHPQLLDHPTRHLFFTGKGGVGKTSLSTACAIALADTGKRVLLVSTDSASNLDEMLGITLANTPVPVPGVPGLSVLNIDPDNAAQSYRARVLAQMEPASTEADRSQVLEQLSGACTTEIAAFDEFANLLSGDAAGFDHVVFDTAPTGHTLRLLSLPKAWTGFLADNDRGASCLGPHSGLKMQEARFAQALQTLSDATQTTVVLVTRPDAGAMAEAARTSLELQDLGLHNQRLAINGVFHASVQDDAVAAAFEALGTQALAAMPAHLQVLPQDQIPLRAFDTVGLPALRALLQTADSTSPATPSTHPPLADASRTLAALTDALAAPGRGLIMVMGKGGVGKTTVAAAIAAGLVQRGHSVHLSTTDPADHLQVTVDGNLPGLKVDRIDPKAETEKYIAKVMAAKSPGLDADGIALLQEDLQSPCTEEVAVFHAFSRIVSEARSAFVVLDTAPTGHSLLLMDATGAYHRQMLREYGDANPGRLITPLMRLQDPQHTRIVLVTLPEVTPVSQASALQDDLRRAKIEPFAWVINKSMAAAGTHDPLLAARLAGEQKQMDRIAAGLSDNTYLLPWLAERPVGIAALRKLTSL
ncbi:MAG: arsenical pump-driving ATPase [Curvibacter sp. RIFCSPHIGHO2_12_FULL_63_18]|uniref:arsenical pump-driving ATPase n=1 Tax=Rhodoferax sp. TaxID=50421 RepID=UPI0008BC89C8|nr:arsenical pump-driving ATPase [Rhodoferax sp.]OGO95671.1 MAG: arsenical pump-driving ATPase [Curvibacter sp. GWA2_63_95]OGP04037.1 MAG: arsenical pump-driving ATPase [Curvibacter sp. RIFCSPHIGHO2_12_FULL_63_18]HCX80422.1 arsenical pump-driving ATPase [Rhodoferax sp.]